jgi:hypothetical protein
MPQNKAEFIPFNAINEFMRPDFRAHILLEVFHHLPELPDSSRSNYNALIRKLVMIQGFRNSTLAPVPLKARSSEKAFEKNASFTASTLQFWMMLHPNLANKVFELMTKNGWEVLPVDADRTKLPGFLTTWPKGQDFSTLNTAFAELYPEEQASPDEISLMAVWLAGRLPINEESESSVIEEGES